ncbi:MAG: hypothetical protein D6762_00305 [Candidatus Neomarinimicrobiota bacterium]|nr:MAG: hypothetical protein D6762_00305 [Candidatus Neomarinimicrobiota bacterium]
MKTFALLVILSLPPLIAQPSLSDQKNRISGDAVTSINTAFPSKSPPAGTPINRTQPDSNTTLIGRWADGPCYAVDVVDSIAYFGNGGYLEIVDISDPANPVELGQLMTPSFVEGVAVSGS